MHAGSEPPGQPDGDGLGGEGGGDGDGPEPSVEPISPDLMFENVTEASAWSLSIVAGSPELLSHVPRATPGVEGSASVG